MSLMVNNILKRIFDLFGAIIAIILLSIPLLFLIFLVRINLGKPVFFRQIRPGLDGKFFTLIKFRTMVDVSSESSNLLSDADRLTKFGKFLRNTSLDELPELWNVFKGDMSFVGPRPLLVEYLPLYSKEQLRRHSVRPGITGWAQINGRNLISWEKKFELDIWYIENRDFLLDLKILFLTISMVLMRDGINASELVTMSKFTGEQKDDNIIISNCEDSRMNKYD